MFGERAINAGRELAEAIGIGAGRPLSPLSPAPGAAPRPGLPLGALGAAPSPFQSAVSRGPPPGGPLAAGMANMSMSRGPLFNPVSFQQAPGQASPAPPPTGFAKGGLAVLGRGAGPRKKVAKPRKK